MKKLITILAPIAVVWFLLVGGLAWYFLRDKSAPLTHPPVPGVTFALEVDPFSLVGQSNGLASLKQAYVKRFARLDIRFHWQEQSPTRVSVTTPPLAPEYLAAVKNCLVHRGQLALRLVHPESDRLSKEAQIVPGYYAATLKRNDRTGSAQDETLLLSHVATPGLEPSPIQSAMVVRGNLGEAQISFQLTPRATAAFGKLTGDNVGRRLAIVVDGQPLTAPLIQSQISGGMGIISGSFTLQQAQELAGNLESPLPAEVRLIEDKSP